MYKCYRSIVSWGDWDSGWMLGSSWANWHIESKVVGLDWKVTKIENRSLTKEKRNWPPEVLERAFGVTGLQVDERPWRGHRGKLDNSRRVLDTKALKWTIIGIKLSRIRRI